MHSSNPPKSSNFREILKRGDEEILIAVMGVTGSGKSYFCHTATGSDIFRVSDELDSCMCIVKVDARW
jgi:Fe-S cluster assembly ATPase SufC